MAAHLDVSPSYVNHVCTGRRPLAPRHCITVERVTGGMVTRYQLRPDVFGEQPALEGKVA